MRTACCTACATACALHAHCRYLDGFEHVHDLCSTHRHAFDFTLLAAPPSRAPAARRRLGALGSTALRALGVQPAQISLDSVVGLISIGLVFLPAVAMIYGMLQATPH